MVIAKVLLLSSVLLLTPLLAVERSAALRGEEVVVVGKLESSTAYPFFVGWRYSGKIVPDEVLWGTAKVGEALPYKHIWTCLPHCDYGWFIAEVLDRSRPRMIARRGVWILWKGENGSWDGPWSEDPGWRPLADRDFAINVLDRRKKELTAIPHVR